jgi:NAD(P)-dependent dehydrogenase (short-subunit alcohol dehydrogenase family)
MSKTYPKHIIVMTGATSGIGAHAVQQLEAETGPLVLTGVRGDGRTVWGAEVFPLDLASLASVRAFADTVKQRLGDATIEMLVLNAGAQFRSEQRSVDGFKMTFAVNYRAHYLLARLLLPSMAEGGRLVITTSDTHDPAMMPGPPKRSTPTHLLILERKVLSRALMPLQSPATCSWLVLSQDWTS